MSAGLEPTGRSGEHNGRAKLTAGQALEIRRAYAKGRETLADLGQRFRVSTPTVHQVIAGKTWKHAGGPVPPPRPDKARWDNRRAKLTAEAVAEIRSAAKAGEATATLALRFGVETTTINRVIVGKTWKHVGGPSRKVKPYGKLTAGQALEIRRAYSEDGETEASLARRFGVDVTNISCVIAGKTWKHAGGRVRAERGHLRGESLRQAKLTAGQALEIRRAYAKGRETLADLGQRFDVSAQTIHRVVTGQAWKPEAPPEWLELVKLGPGQRVIARGEVVDDLSQADVDLLRALRDAGPVGLDGPTLKYEVGAEGVKTFHRLRRRGGKLGSVLHAPRQRGRKCEGTHILEDNYRIGIT